MVCKHCGAANPDGAKFCHKCGTKVEVLRCPSCGKEPDFGADFCIYCGQRLKEETPMAEPEQEVGAPMEETTSQPELKAPKEEKRSEPAEKAPTSEAAEPDVEVPADLEPSKEDPSNPEGPQEFTWAQKKPQGRAGSAITTVRLRLEQEMLHIQKEFSDTITSHKNTLPEETIPLSEIESVYIQKKGPSIAVILLFLCVALVLYGGVSGKLNFGTTALCLLGLAVIIALRYQGQMKRYQLVIVKNDGKEIALEGDDPQTMDEVAMAIVTGAGIDPWVARSTGKRAGHKPIWIILGVAVILLLGVLIVPELYLKQSFPAGVIKNSDVRNYVGTEVNGDLNYQVTAEVTGGKLVKKTAMPQYKDGLFTYYFVDCIYDVTVKDDSGESASGQVTVNCSFSIKPFSGKPEDIIFNSFTYSDDLTDFVDELAPTNAAENESNVNGPTSEPASSGPSIYDMVGRYFYDGSFTADGQHQDFFYSLTIRKQDSDLLIYAMWRGNYIIPDTMVGPEAFKDNVLTFSNGMEKHTLTFVPALESAFGVNTIYLDGNEEMPFCIMDGSFNDFAGTWREHVDDNACMLYIDYSNGDASFRLVFPSGGEEAGRLEMDYYGGISLAFGGLEYNLDVYNEQLITLSRYDDEQGFLFYYFERTNYN